MAPQVFYLLVSLKENIICVNCFVVPGTVRHSHSPLPLHPRAGPDHQRDQARGGARHLCQEGQ